MSKSNKPIIRHVHIDAKGWQTITYGTVVNETTVSDIPVLEVLVSRIHARHQDAPELGRNLPFHKGRVEVFDARECLPLPVGPV